MISNRTSWFLPYFDEGKSWRYNCRLFNHLIVFFVFFTTWSLSYKSLISKRTLVALPQDKDGHQHKPFHNSFSFSAYCWFTSFAISHEWESKFLFFLSWFTSSPIRGLKSNLVLFLTYMLVYFLSYSSHRRAHSSSFLV